MLSSSNLISHHHLIPTLNEPHWEHANLYWPFVYTSEFSSLFIQAGIYNQKEGEGDKTEKKEFKENKPMEVLLGNLSWLRKDIIKGRENNVVLMHGANEKEIQ